MNSGSKDLLPIAVDSMGADHGPEVVVQGAILAAKELGIHSILVGDQNILNDILKSFGAENLEELQVEHAPEVITMEDSPSLAIRGKTRSSIRIAFELVKKGTAAAVVSPGNTGAMMAAGLFVCGSLPGIARPAIATLIPKTRDGKPTVLLDSGANVDCNADQLVQFALMGECFARLVLSLASPRIGILSNGSEKTKGNDITRAASQMLSSVDGINFIGYVEGRDFARDSVDVVVCDGFVGNIILKAMEGSVELVFDSIKYYIERSLTAKIGMWLVKPMFKKLFNEKLDPSTHGGAPLLGLNEVAIVCHGSANSKAIMNGVRAAKKLVVEDLVFNLGQSLDLVEIKVGNDSEESVWSRVGRSLYDKNDLPKNER